MADTSHLPDDVLYALRTGKIPPHLERAYEESGLAPAEPEDTEEADALKARYTQMVEERVSDWHEDHSTHWGPIPAAERKLIEDDCYRQLQYQQHAQRQADSAEDEWDPGADPLHRKHR